MCTTYSNAINVVVYFLAKSTQTHVKPYHRQLSLHVHMPRLTKSSRENQSSLIHVPGTSETSRKAIAAPNGPITNYDKVAKVVLNPAHMAYVTSIGSNTYRRVNDNKQSQADEKEVRSEDNRDQNYRYDRKRKHSYAFDSNDHLNSSFAGRTSTFEKGKETLTDKSNATSNEDLNEADRITSIDFDRAPRVKERPKSLTSLLVFKTPTFISTGSSVSLNRYKYDSSEPDDG